MVQKKLEVIFPVTKKKLKEIVQLNPGNIPRIGSSSTGDGWVYAQASDIVLIFEKSPVFPTGEYCYKHYTPFQSFEYVMKTHRGGYGYSSDLLEQAKNDCMGEKTKESLEKYNKWLKEIVQKEESNEV